jgi:prevent-host-death family protein
VCGTEQSICSFEAEHRLRRARGVLLTILVKIAKIAKIEAYTVTGGRILVVDDEPSVLKSYAHSLTKAGFDVVQASDGADALHRIESDQFDLIFSDISMPKFNGFTLLRRLRLRAPDLPVVLMLDKPDNRATIKATELGAIQSLVKPIASDLLAETASYAVRLHRSRRSTQLIQQYRGGERPDAASISATDAKNEFGRILEKAIQGGTIVITKHEAPKAVLISVDQFNDLSRAYRMELETLSSEFDALLARMQKSTAQTAMKAAFEASPRQLGRAALGAATRKRA